MTLRLSEAIRLGAMLRPQGFLAVFRDGTSCAIGAAMEAIGFAPETWDYDLRLFDQTWPWHKSDRARCPSCHQGESIGATIAHLNDNHMWTREQIADWVETLEAAQQAAATQDTSVAVEA